MKQKIIIVILLVLSILTIGCTLQSSSESIAKKNIIPDKICTVEDPCMVTLPELTWNATQFVDKEIIVEGTMRKLCNVLISNGEPVGSGCAIVLQSETDSILLENAKLTMLPYTNEEKRIIGEYKIQGVLQQKGCENVGPTELCAPIYYIDVKSWQPIVTIAKPNICTEEEPCTVTVHELSWNASQFVDKNVIVEGEIKELCYDIPIDPGELPECTEPECRKSCIKILQSEKEWIELRNIGDIYFGGEYTIQGIVNREGCENIDPTASCAPRYYINVESYLRKILDYEKA